MNQLKRDVNNTENDQYIQSWYPVSRSCELKKGQHKAIKIFGLDWILFRTNSGQVSFLDRYCSHMGSDLCNGKVIGEALQCPLHAWQFDTKGQCVHIPNYIQTSPKRQIHSLHCEEKYGLVFVFWGKSPLFALPSPPDIQEQQAFSYAKVQDINTSYHALSLNTFDTQHYRHIHNRSFVGTPEIYPVDEYALRIDFEVTISQRRRWVDRMMNLLNEGNFNISIECWGSNLVAITNHDLKVSALAALQPMDKQHTNVYLVALRAQQGKATLLDKLRLSIAVNVLQNFLSTDQKALNNMRLHTAGLLDDLDKGAKLYWNFVEGLPRSERKLIS